LRYILGYEHSAAARCRNPARRVRSAQHAERSADSDRLIDYVVRWHDHQQIDVALLVRLAVRIRSKQNDLVRVEASGNLACETPDR
jgi:hypothetical protein